MRHTARALIAAATLLGLAAFAPAATTAQTTTIILVRHAEKAATPANDPPLTDAGHERALALAGVVADAGISAIYSTQYRRTRETAQPVSERIGVPVTVVTIERGRSADHPGELVRALLERHAGAAVLVVGHSNTVPAIVAALGVDAAITIGDDDYDGLYVVRVEPGGGASLVRGRYGAP